MKCPNCGEELGKEKKCKQCGETIKSTKTQEKTNSFEAIQGDGKGFRKTGKLGFVFLTMLVIIVALGGYYALAMNQPRYIFDKKISEFINTKEENTEYNTLKTTANLELSINSDNPAMQEMANLLKDTQFSVSTEFDKSSQEELVGIQLSKANETLLDANLKLEAETQNLYVNLGQLFDKTILANMAELSDETFERADTSIATFGQKMSSKKAQTIFESELKAELKEEYFSKEKTKIQKENVTKNTLKLSAEECMAVMKNVGKNLSENEQFLGCFEDGETLKTDLQDMVDELETYDVEEDIDISLDVYTVGFLKKIKRVDISVEDDTSKITMQLTKAGDEEYAYELFEDSEKILDGNIKIKEENDNFTLEMTANAEGTEIVIKLSGSTVYNEALSNFDTSHVVKYEELTTEDIYTLFGNFMNSKLYQIIQEFSGNGMGSLLTDDSDEEVGDTASKDRENEVSSNLAKNVIKTYHDAEIKFNIPEGFQIYSQDNDHYRLFEKESEDFDIQVDVSAVYQTIEEYFEDRNSMAEEYKEDEDYENVKISNIEEFEVNGNKFKKLVITYDYKFSDEEKMSFSEAYIAHSIDHENIVTVEIDGANFVTDKELEQFLTIEK